MQSTGHQKQPDHSSQTATAPRREEVGPAVSNGLMVDLLGLSSSGDSLGGVLDAWAREEADLGLGGEVPLEALAAADGAIEWLDVPEVEAPLKYGLVWALLERIDGDNTDGSQVVVGNNGAEMDLWSWVTGQQQTEGDLDAIVDEAIRNAGGQKIDSFEFKSHGTENGQLDVVAGESLGPKLTAKQKQAFDRLGQHMAEGGVIVLAGCNVAANFEDHLNKGTSLLLEVAQAASCAVTAGVAVQLPLDGIEGTQVTVQPDGSYTIETSAGAWVYDQAADGGMALVHWAVGLGLKVKTEGENLVDEAVDGAEAVVDGAKAGVAGAVGEAEAAFAGAKAGVAGAVEGAVDEAEAVVDAVTEWWAAG